MWCPPSGYARLRSDTLSFGPRAADRLERNRYFFRRYGLRIGVGRIAEPISYPTRLGQNVFRPCRVILDVFAQRPIIGPQVLQFTAIFRTPDSAQKLDMTLV